MANPLQQRRTAAEWAAAGQIIEIKEKISGFERLSSIVETDLAALDTDKIPADWRDSVVAGTMVFGFADGQRRVPTVNCTVALTVDAVCQRCMKAFRLPLETEAKLLLLSTEETAEELEDFEVWELEEQTLRAQDIVEELLVLALPFSAMHTDLASCTALSAGDVPQDKTTTPFATLRAQMNQDQ